MRGQSGILTPAPPKADRGDPGRGRWSWLVTAGDIFEAELLKGLLESVHIPVMTDSFDRSPFAWMYPAGNVQRPVHIYVPASLLDVARLELLESSFVHSARVQPVAAASAPVRERTRPVVVIVALLTALIAGWLVVVEVLRFAPCSARIFCIDRAPAVQMRP